MSEDTTPDDIDGEGRFNERLGHLLAHAHQNGVSVEGGWTCRNHADAVPDWDVTVTELKKPRED